MKIAILGYGIEGRDAEKYFRAKGHDCRVFDNFQPADVPNFQLEDYDLVLRSPSVKPMGSWSSLTQYFFKHCPCPIIGITGTKGKGTTCSIITALLKALGKHAQLVGNIGTSAITVLDNLKEEDVIVYELSSFQLWDLKQSPHIAVVLRIEPDHLDVHDDYSDYLSAKSNITKHQSSADYCIYYRHNPDSVAIAEQSPGTKLPYPSSDDRSTLEPILSELNLPGDHNKENAEAALLAVAAFLKISLAELVSNHADTIIQAFRDFQGLPHRIQFVRELNHVKYYDDNYSSAPPALDVALKAFTEPLVLIAGGKDKHFDLTSTKERIFSTPNLIQAIFIGETKEQLAAGEDPSKFKLASTLKEAVQLAQQFAEQAKTPAVVVMSPGTSSFDMFKNFKDRGEQFQQIVNNLGGDLWPQNKPHLNF